MTMKIKLTQKQASFIEEALAGEFDKEEILNRFARSNCFERRPSHSLHGLCVMDLARALLIGYEVESQYEVGDVVRYWRTDYATAIGKITYIDYESKKVHFDNTTFVKSTHDITGYATPEEVAQEKEKRFWKSIGREVGEFRKGDVGVFRNGMITSRFYNFEDYRDDLVGFYPIESFVSFGGDEE